MPKRVLLVEDEEIILADLARTVRSQGYEVAGMALSGREAVLAVAEVQPDVVLMDIRLQGSMDGLEAALQIRRTNQVPIIFVTANAGALGVADFPGRHLAIVKPFAPNELRAALEAVLRS